ncbi:MAG: hypothetical protein QW650_00015 [Thermofilum sp.]
MIGFGRIVAVDKERYCMDVLGDDGRFYSGVQIPMIAGVDGVYGLSFVPAVGQRCVILGGSVGFAVLPIFSALGEKGFNARKEIGGKVHLSRKPKGVEGELFLSLPQTVLDVLPDGRLYLYLGDFENVLTSVEMEPTFTKIKTASFSLIAAGMVFEHVFDEESGEGRTWWHFQRFREGGTKVDFSASDKVELSCETPSSKLEAALGEGFSFSVPGLKISCESGLATLSVRDLSASGESLRLEFDGVDLSAKALELKVGNVTVRVSAGKVSVEAEGAFVALERGKVEVAAREVEVNARVRLKGDVVVDGTLRARNGEFDAVRAGRVTVLGEDVATVPKVQNALESLAFDVSAFAAAYSAHTHATSGAFTTTPIGSAPAINPPRLL